ncbi:MAG: HAMP domain-containing sensor histidine kinase [Sandaracinaceae bacterium]
MARRSIRSISVPITFGAVTVPLAAALTVGWTLFLMARISESGEVEANVWLLVLGLFAFVVIMAVLVMFTIFLAREIVEGRRQDSFIDSVTHELKSPLASMKLCLQTLEREGLPEDKRAALRAMMRDDIDRLSSFIDEVLQANRLAHGEMGVELQELALRPIADHCADATAARHKISRDKIQVRISEDLRVYTDRTSIEIVLRNLIDNAVKYSGETVEVVVEADRDPVKGTTIVRVSDRGIGLGKTDLLRVFERFYRVNREAVRKRKGTGLGLFVVSALVKNLGGSVSASSPGEGQGTTFVVRLPQRAADRR